MVNLSSLNTTVTELFSVISTVISEFVTLLTGDLLVLVIVAAVISVIVGLLTLLLGYIKKQFSSSVQMKK